MLLAWGNHMGQLRAKQTTTGLPFQPYFIFKTNLPKRLRDICKINRNSLGETRSKAHKMSDRRRVIMVFLRMNLSPIKWAICLDLDCETCNLKTKINGRNLYKKRIIKYKWTCKVELNGSTRVINSFISIIFFNVMSLLKC